VEPDDQSDALVKPAALRVTANMGVARAGVRSYMSSWLLRSARRFVSVAEQIERDRAGVWGSPHVEEHLDHVISAVLNAATFLEAMINELFTDASAGHGLTGDGYLAPLDSRTVELMAAWWDETDQGFDRTLNKYQLLLAFAGSGTLDRGAEPYQSAKLLLELRNAVVHYRPSTVYADEEHALERKLKAKFAPNGLFGSGGPWWPNGALGAGCGAWAIESAQRLADEVSARVGIEPNYQRVPRS
jgi:hypothetical protein